MLQSLAKFAAPVLESNKIRQTRRNHALEHATIHLLSKRVKGLRVAGRSDAGGFVIMGEVSTEAVNRAAHDALERMRKGEHDLAIHPNCGTNLVTTGTMATLVGMVGFGGKNRDITGNRFSWTLTAMMLAILASQPLGMALQKHFTTKGDPGELEILSVTRSEMTLPMMRKMVVHRVDTQSG